MKYPVKKMKVRFGAALGLVFLFGLSTNARAEDPKVNVRVSTPAGQIEVNRPPPQPVVVVPVAPPPQKIVVERPAPPPPPAPEPPSGGCHCSLVPFEPASAAGLLSCFPLLLWVFLRRITVRTAAKAERFRSAR